MKTQSLAKRLTVARCNKVGLYELGAEFSEIDEAESNRAEYQRRIQEGPESHWGRIW